MSTHVPDGSTLAYGVATASYQIEGATEADGRGPSVWDTFTAKPGTIRDGSDGSTACDSYTRYAEDLDLAARMLGPGGWYRFSVAWPRILPDGTGQVETRGLDYYDRVVDGALERGINPTATLYHWDLPQTLEDRGGWPVRDTAEAFADYAMVVHDRLGDRVKVWATHNEPWCAAYLGYAAGIHAPGRAEGGVAHRAAHHLMLGHAWAADRMRAAGATDVGIVLNLVPVWPEDPEDPKLAPLTAGVDAIRNGVWLDPLIDGAYGESVLAVAPELSDPDLVHDGDLDAIRGTADWLGINYYTPFRTALPDGGAPRHHELGAFPGVGRVAIVVREPRTAIGWEVEARGLEELLVDVHERTGLPLLVTENGAAYADDRHVDRDGTSIVDDQDRIAYLTDHLAAADRARDRGADLRGYIFWTLLDNFEWAEGYTKTFGLVHVDPHDQNRTPKASYHWLADRLARHDGHDT